MKGNIGSIVETGPHKPLVAGSNPAAATYCFLSELPQIVSIQLIVLLFVITLLRRANECS